MDLGEKMFCNSMLFFEIHLMSYKNKACGWIFYDYSRKTNKKFTYM